MSKKKNTGTAAAAGRSVYESKVGVEAVIRSGGKTPQLKGVIHEMLYRDSVTFSPTNLANGTVGVLSKSPTAVRDDVLIKQGSKIISRTQLKDTVSTSGVAKTVKQAASGKYARTNLKGTVETTKLYNQAADQLMKAGGKAPQKMTSTGISSTDTSRIAAQTVGGSLKAASVAKCALTSGGAGAAISGGVEILHSGARLLKGEIDGEEFAGNVARETVGGGLSAAAGSAAASVASVAAASLLAGTAAPLWVPGAIAVGTAVAVGSGIKSLWDCLFD